MVTYGVDIMGMSSTHLLNCRRMIARATAPQAGGKSTDHGLYPFDAHTATLDPAFDAHVLPPQSLALAWWESWQPRESLNAAIQLAKTKVLRDGAAVWSRVTGPIGAAVATASRIGWTTSSGHTLVCDNGETVDLSLDPPIVGGQLDDGGSAGLPIATRACFRTNRTLQRQCPQTGPENTCGASSISLMSSGGSLHQAAPSAPPLSWGSRSAKAPSSQLCLEVNGHRPILHRSKAGLMTTDASSATGEWGLLRTGLSVRPFVLPQAGKLHQLVPRGWPSSSSKGGWRYSVPGASSLSSSSCLVHHARPPSDGFCNLRMNYHSTQSGSSMAPCSTKIAEWRGELALVPSSRHLQEP